MHTPIIRLKTSKFIDMPVSISESTQGKIVPSAYRLKWRNKKLWVSLADRSSHETFSLYEHEQWLAECLQYSSVEQVHLDTNLGEARINFWTNACEKSKKKVFIRLKSDEYLTKRQSTACWQIKQILDVMFASLILLFLTPILLGLAVLIRLTSPGPILFRQWRAGKRGQLFRILKFRTMTADAEKSHHDIMHNCSGRLHKVENDPRVTFVGYWMRRLSLDELPQLLNVLRGEMSLVGPRPWALYDALRVNRMGRNRLNALPGITGFWQIKGRSNVLDLDAVTNYDLEYLHNWSLGFDLGILLMTIPRVISGFGAF